MDQQPYELPDVWEWKSLKDICDFENGDRGKNYPSRDAFVEKGIPVINAGNLNGWTVDSAGLNYINEERYNLIGGGKIKRGDILYCLRGSLGKCGIVDSIDRGVIASSLVIVRPSNEIIKELLLYYFNSSLSSHFVTHYNNGAAQPNLSAKSLSLFKIPLPPLSEQKRIVEKLDCLISRIDQAVNHLQESLGLAEALFASELNIMFSVIEDRQEIAALAEVKGGKRLPKGCQLQDEKTDYPYIRVSDFNDNGSIDVLNVKFITKEVQEKISRYTITNQDLYISIAGTIGKTGFVPQELDGANLTENAAKLVIKNKDTLFLNYLYYFTKTSDFATQAGLATKQVAQPKLALTRLSKIQIPLCDISQQKRIVKKLDQVAKNKEELKDKLQGQIDDLNALKASLLDAAFRGDL